MDLVSLNRARKYTNKRVSPAYATAMFNPAVDIVYDSCYRDVTEPLDVYANDIKTDSGHSWEPIAVGGRSPVLQYRPTGLYLSSTGGSTVASPMGISLIGDFESETPYIAVRMQNEGVPHWRRTIYLKYVDADNWLAIETSGSNYRWGITVSIDGEETVIAQWGNVDSPSARLNTVRIYADIRSCHVNVGESTRAAFVVVDYDQAVFVGFSNEQWDAIKELGRVGIGVPVETWLYGLCIGHSRSG